jgi:hypothetical protein
MMKALVSKNGSVDTFRLSPRVNGCAIWINDKALQGWLRSTERRAKTNLPGEYEWLPPELALLPSRHLLGEPARDGGEWTEDWGEQGWGAGKTAIGGCLCGSVGCGPLLVTIELEKSAVVWRDFVTRESDDYGLTFTFSRKQYEHELRLKDME